MKVTCAIIEHEGKVLCAQRSANIKHPQKWKILGWEGEMSLNYKKAESFKKYLRLSERLPLWGLGG